MRHGVNLQGVLRRSLPGITVKHIEIMKPSDKAFTCGRCGYSHDNLTAFEWHVTLECPALQHKKNERTLNHIWQFFLYVLMTFAALTTLFSLTSCKKQDTKPAEYRLLQMHTLSNTHAAINESGAHYRCPVLPVLRHANGLDLMSSGNIYRRDSIVGGDTLCYTFYEKPFQVGETVAFSCAEFRGLRATVFNIKQDRQYDNLSRSCNNCKEHFYYTFK
jgi:hypothetical protein